MQDDELLNEQAQLNLINKPSPRMQGFIEKYNKLDYATAKKYKVENVKMMIDDYQSGNLHKELPDLSDEEVVKAIAKMESQDDGPDDSFLSKALDVPVQVVGGFRDAAQAVMDLGSSVGEWGAGKVLESQGFDKQTIDQAKKDTKGIQLPEVSAPKSTVGSLTRGVSQFLAPFGVLSKAGKAAGVVGKATSTVGKFAEASAVGAATDFLAFGEHEKRLSDLVETQPALSNPVTRYLKSDINDGVAEGRFKNAIEGLGLGMMTEGLFQSVKWIKNTKETKSAISQLKADTSVREGFVGKSYDDLVKELNQIPIREKTPTTLDALKKTADKAPDWKIEDLLSGKALKEVDAQSVQPLAIKATMIQEQAYKNFTEALPDYKARIDAGDPSAVNDYWAEMVKLHELDFVAKDIAAKHGGAEAMVLRRHTSAVSQANAMNKVFAKADNLDQRKIIDAHMHIMETGGDVDNFVNALTMTKGEKVKHVIKSVYMANVLSSPVTHFKNIVSSGLNSLVYAPLEHAAAAAISPVRKKIGLTLEQRAGQKIASGFFSNLNDGVEWKEANILFHSQISSIADAVKYIGRAIKGETDTALAAAKRGDKISRLKDISDAASSNRFDKGVSYDNIASNGFDAASLGLEKEKLMDSTMYHLANFIGNYSKIPGKVIQTYDDAMKGMFFKAKVEAQAYRLAVEEGLSGDALKARWKDLYNAATFKPDISDDIINSSRVSSTDTLYSSDSTVKSIQEEGLKFADEYSYTKKLGPIATSFQNLRDNIDKMMPIIPGGSIVMPFMKTPVNLMKFFLVERGPLAPLTKVWQADFRAGGARADMAMARLAMGSSMFGLGLYLSANGYVFGDGPKNPAEKALHRELGIQERSVRIGDKFIDIGWLDPIASFLLYPANIMELSDKLDNDIDDDDLSEQMQKYAAAGILGLSNLFLSKSFTMGLSELTAAIVDQDEKNFSRVLKNYASAFVVPNAASFAGQVINPAMQDADTLWETIQAKAGIDVRPRRDIFGNEVSRNPKINNFMFPISYSNWQNDKVVASIIDAGAYIQKPKRIVENVKLTYDEYDKLMGYMKEQDVYGSIKRLVESPMYQSIPDTDKAIDEEGKSMKTKEQLVKMVYNKHLQIAKDRLVASDPALEKRVLDFKIKSFTKPARTSGDTRLLNNLSGKINN